MHARDTCSFDQHRVALYSLCRDSYHFCTAVIWPHGWKVDRSRNMGKGTPLLSRSIFELPTNAVKIITTHLLNVRIQHIAIFCQKIIILDVFHQLNIQKFLCRDLHEDISPVMRDGSNLTSFYSSPAGNVLQHTMSI